MPLAELDLFQHRVDRWRKETFGRREQAVDLARIIAHLKREVNELEAAPLDPEEAADVFLLLLGVASAGGYSLIGAAMRKFDQLQGRTWGEPDSEGVCEHVRESGD